MTQLEVKVLSKDDVYKDIIRVPEKYRYDTKKRFIDEGSVCLIRVGSKNLYVIIRGDGVNEKPEIGVDERLRNRLGLCVGDKKEIIFERSKLLLWREFWWAWHASDPAYRISAKLGVLSVALGLVALLITFKK